jgi:beta-galactosidase
LKVTYDFFPVSVWYGASRARAPMIQEINDIDKVIKDIENVKKLGFNSIRFWYDWATAEPKPYFWNFEVIETLLSITDKLGIKAIVQVYTDSAPNWVEYEYPDSLFEDRSGLKIHSQASPGYCSDHPEVRKHINEYLVKLAEVVSKHEFFYAWDIWSEPHIVQWSWIDYMKEPWFCYCQNSQKRFIEWLKKKYGSIDILNKVWYRKHRNWDEVIAPRYVSLSSFKDLLDWIQFNIEKIAEDLEWKTQTIKSVDKKHIVSSHAAISCIYGIPGIGYGASDDWKLSEKVDVWGTSFYPKHTGPWMPLKPHQMGVALDASRSSCESREKSFWIGELQTGHGVTGLRFGEPVDEKDVERWAWLAVSRNAKGLNYYAWLPMSCGYEISGFGLSNYDGEFNERAIATGNVSKIITENMGLFLNSKPLESEVGILYNVEAYKMLACLRANSADIVRKDIFGIYKAIMDLNVNVDFLHLEDLKNQNLSKYKIIFLPFSIAIDEESAKILTKYVKNGGTLVADGRLGWMDSNGILSEKIPGAGLNEVFGCEELWMKEIDGEIKLSVKGFGKVSAFKYLCTYRSIGKVVAEYQNIPVIVENNYYNGKTVMIGTMIGLGYEEIAVINNLRYLQSLILRSGVNVYYDFECLEGNRDSIEFRVTKSHEKLIIYIFNHSKNHALLNLKISKNIILNPVKKITDLKSKKMLSYHQDQNDLILPDISLEAGETLVCLIE